MLTFVQFLSESPEFDGVHLVHAGSGNNWHEWDIHHPVYGKLGQATLINHHQNLDKATTAKLDVSTEENDKVPDHLRSGDTSEGPRYKLGASHIKHLLGHIRRQVSSQYPNIKTLHSDRTTGVKANKGTATIKMHESAPIKLHMSNLVTHRKSMFDAMSDVSSGKRSHTKGPLEVIPIHKEPGNYQLIDGYHRHVENMLKGKHHVNVKVNDSHQAHDYSVARPDQRLHYDAHAKYRGLEDMADDETLGDLHHDLYGKHRTD